MMMDKNTEWKRERIERSSGDLNCYECDKALCPKQGWLIADIFAVLLARLD
jgi:hypothetical protein